MEKIIKQLIKIEDEHAEFFKESEKSITDYITKGMFNAGLFINTDLPIEITNKIRKALDEIYVSPNAEANN